MGWLAGVLAILVVLFWVLYWKAITECRNVSNYALLILLDESVYAAQRAGLIELVRSIKAENAGELGQKVNLSLSQLAARLGGTLLGTGGMLWKLKQSTTEPPSSLRTGGASASVE